MIKLYLDEDVHKKITPALLIKGYDVVSAHDVKNWGIVRFRTDGVRCFSKQGYFYI